MENMDGNKIPSLVDSKAIKFPLKIVKDAEGTEMVMFSDSNDSGASIGSKSWADLESDVLTEIFRRLPFEDRLRVVPLVCKSWNESSYNPLCWTVVEMNSWLHKKTEENALEDSIWLYDNKSHSKLKFLIKVKRRGQLIRQLQTAAM
ncbi:unnamed protein product [Calypogeia fissa]